MRKYRDFGFVTRGGLYRSDVCLPACAAGRFAVSCMDALLAVTFRVEVRSFSAGVRHSRCGCRLSALRVGERGIVTPIGSGMGVAYVTELYCCKLPVALHVARSGLSCCLAFLGRDVHALCKRALVARGVCCVTCTSVRYV